ncbi:DNA/RNA non-specific endonuclease [Umezawaea sp. Da 62-37]|uniref:DNA/RNA non-specific endonuclease n=1 Tax=Umezawaea sp. Da 62-37 TaxID=3075927 RepID=UPI0028F6FEAA|nr:DNA/RNA non-specific endonuclease [Umezawaea sp. Da 62-37]WNV82700.1 DNA/RNA non-specific endonuclease [Umezawaea sp. Da 62-37]
MAGRESGKAAPGTGELLASLRRFIRARGSDYLRDDNVSSIGVGYKERDGRATKEISVQFTVRRKAQPEELEALGTTALPAVIVVDGFEVPTDVLQRQYRADFRVVSEAAAVDRKVRADPIAPGASVGHVGVSAGTIGCVVYDRADGTPYVLSNWHVLHGPGGALGEDVVQPGRHDDNRVDRNRLGRLVRSYLGKAGDCAIASIEDRGYDVNAMGLDVAVTQIGEPELGDKVVKSGRTTGVTHGVVRRVDVLVKIDYGGPQGEQEIGGFEIGVDPRNAPADGEISSGGDSGAAWIFKLGNGRPSKVLAGLHFAGEGGGDPDEHALACLPRSVFEKLEVTLDPPSAVVAQAVPTGYDADFLGVRVDVPALTAATRDDAVLLGGSERIDYTHFSLAMSGSRRFALWVAWNIDGGSLRKLDRDGIPFVKDPRLPADTQIGDELYKGNRLDRGHIARRADLIWGTAAVADKANTDSFYFTNITPQMDDFNQSAKAGLWGGLEDALFADVEVDDLRVSVSGGPVFAADDRVFRSVALPREFWKVITFTVDGELRTRAFLLTQNLDQLEALDLDEFRVFQVAVAELEERTGLRFPAVLHEADTAVPEVLGAGAGREPLAGTEDIDWA